MRTLQLYLSLVLFSSTTFHSNISSIWKYFFQEFFNIFHQRTQDCVNKRINRWARRKNKKSLLDCGGWFRSRWYGSGYSCIFWRTAAGWTGCASLQCPPGSCLNVFTHTVTGHHLLCSGRSLLQIHPENPVIICSASCQGRLRVCGQQNISGAPQQTSVTAFSGTTEVDIMAPYSSSGVIQISKSPKMPNWFEITLFTPRAVGWACAPASDEVCFLSGYKKDFGFKMGVNRMNLWFWGLL